MNTVSFLIYLTHVLPTLGIIFGIAATILGITSVISIVVWFVASGEASSHRATEDDKRLPTTVLSIVKLAASGFLISGLLTVVFPNTQTMYMIAASELGEEVIVSTEAKQLYQDLRDVLASYKKAGDDN